MKGPALKEKALHCLTNVFFTSSHGYPMQLRAFRATGSMDGAFYLFALMRGLSGLEWVA